MTTKTILAVDDDPFILVVVEKFLKMKGYKVVTMTDPEKAYFWAEENKPDLVISDVAMPGVDGFTLIRNLRDNKDTAHIPLVMLTATDKIADVEKGFESGARAYILKPIDWDRAWKKLQPLL
jgi:two-component system, OmpR family, alkaline phosphatase synthesis response regulator PhoP